MDKDENNLERSIDSLVVDTELPRDRILQRIRKPKTAKGQFGIKTILGLTTLLAFYFAFPNIVGWDPKAYYILTLIWLWVFLPGALFLLVRVGIEYGFKMVAVAMSVSILVMLAPAVIIWAGPQSAIAFVLWAPQIIVVVWIHRLFKLSNLTAENFQANYDESQSDTTRKQAGS